MKLLTILFMLNWFVGFILQIRLCTKLNIGRGPFKILSLSEGRDLILNIFSKEWRKAQSTEVLNLCNAQLFLISTLLLLFILMNIKIGK